jgi:hypothetical protein
MFIPTRSGLSSHIFAPGDAQRIFPASFDLVTSFKICDEEDSRYIEAMWLRNAHSTAQKKLNMSRLILSHLKSPESTIHPY